MKLLGSSSKIREVSTLSGGEGVWDSLLSICDLEGLLDEPFQIMQFLKKAFLRNICSEGQRSGQNVSKKSRCEGGSTLHSDHS